MTKIYRFAAVAILVVCGCMLASQAEARVCFATDPDCGAGGNFGNMDDLAQNDCACIAEGYTCPNTSALQCKKIVGWEPRDKVDWQLPADKIGYIIGKNASSIGDRISTRLPISTDTCHSGSLKYRCPYNSACTKCCDPDYSYASCSYPLEIAGKCGDKYKCRCDKEKFGYNDNYDTTSCEKKYPGSLAGGGSCVETSFSSAEQTMKTDIYYSDCICNRATYPYLKEDCANGTEPSEDGCTGTDGTTRYSSCICNTSIYPFQPGDCEFGGNMDKKEYYCIQGGSYHFKLCYNCDAYPATSLDHVKGGEGIGYEKCTYGNRYKILQCESGYRPGKDGNNCRELTCEEAVDEWLSTYPAQKERYTLLASAQNIEDSHLVNATSSSYQIKTQNVILGDDQTITYMYPGINYYGASAFGKLKGGYMAERCKLRPIITYKPSSNGFYIPSHAPFNYGSATKGKVNLYGLKLKLNYSGTFSTAYGINGVNTDIYATNWEIPQTVDYAPSFTYNAYYDNEGYEAMPSINISGTMTIKSYFSSNGYSYNTESGYSWGTINIAFPDSFKDAEIAKFTFKENQEFKVKNLYIFPLNSNDCSEASSCRVDYNTTVNFVGPSSEEAANVYTNISLGRGYINSITKGGRNIYAQISGHLIWNMYKGSIDYDITLSTGSKLYSTNYGVGEYAYIKRGSDSKWSWCYMDRNQLYADRKKDAWLCTDSCENRKRYNDNYFAVCSKTKSSQYMTGSVYYTAKGATNCSCSQQSTSIDRENCQFSAGGFTQTPIYCGE